MSARTYICIPCRWARRADAAYGRNTSFRCPTCGASLWELEWRWRIPRKTNDKGWKELAEKVSAEAPGLAARSRAIGRQKISALDAKTANVEKQRDSEKRAARLKKLRNECTAISTLYA